MKRQYQDLDGVIHEREDGLEYPDPTPVAIPLRFTRGASLNEVVRRMVRSEELARLAEEAGAETWEEADDFDIGEDNEPTSPYEEEFEGLPVKKLRELKLIDDEKTAQVQAGAGDGAPPDPTQPPKA